MVKNEIIHNDCFFDKKQKDIYIVIHNGDEMTRCLRAEMLNILITLSK